MSQSNECRMKKEKGECFRESCEKLETLKAEARAKILASMGDGYCDFCKSLIEKNKNDD